MKPREAIQNLQPGDHVYFMRENGDEIIVSLLEDGLRKNQLCCYIGDHISMLEKELKNKGHQLEFLHPEDIIKKGFDPLHAITILKEYVKKAEEGGFSGLRVVQEMSWISRKVPGWKKYIEYEELLTALCSQHNVVAVCCYGSQIPADVLLQAVTIHPLALVQKALCKNFYYLPESVREDPSSIMVMYGEYLTKCQHTGELEFLAAVVEEVMEAVIITDNQGMIIYVNPAACSMFQYSKEELEGQRVNILNSKNSQVTFQEIIKGKRDWKGEMLAIKRDGNRFPLWLRTSAVHNEKGEITAFISVARDITEQKETEEKLQRYALLLEMKVREKTRSTETLLKTSYALRSTSDWKKGTEIITRGIIEGLGFDRTAVFFVNEHDQVLECKGQLNMSDALLRVNLPLTDDRYAAVRCVTDKRPLLVKDVLTDPRVKAHLKEEVKEFVWVPILFQSEVLGAIEADKKWSQNPIEPEDVDMLELYANQIAEFIERTRLVVKPEVELQVSTPLKYDLELQEVYLIEEEKSEKAFDIFVDLVKHGFKGFGICRTHPQKIREKYGLERTPVMWLSEIESKQLEHVGSQDLPKLIYLVAEFVKRAQPAVIILEGLEYLMVQNDFKNVLKLVYTLSDYVATSQSVLLLPVNPHVLPAHEHTMLKRAFTVVSEPDEQ
ncbi:MAG: DUF835 domain-containing protein [Theionarchaea archaeon]|nr:MAG: hypothetical protein AYK18_14370 [Theionarchaea archaeon DG-70]MBU7011511.1 DUF835 domain-containing protein [Theionarchaea archaeon]